jgi:hypothetical protein
MGPELKNMIRISFAAAMFAGLAVSLSGCVVYHAASTVVDAGATVVDAVTAPFGSSDSDSKSSK